MATMTIPEFSKKIDALGKRFPGIPLTSPLKNKCLPLIRRGIEENFIFSQNPDGNAWPPLIDPEADHPPLLKTRELFKSATRPSHQNHIEEVRVRSLTFNTNLFYAVFQNEGTSFIPPREFMGISARTEAACLNELADFVEQKIGV